MEFVDVEPLLTKGAASSERKAIRKAGEAGYCQSFCTLLYK
jgi:hypothetical protein